MESLRSVIRYRSGYKYQLARQYCHPVPFGDIVDPAMDRWISIENGVLYIGDGYAWDGPSGPALDTRDAMRGSLVHDALYQLIREGLLPSSAREDADKLLRSICREVLVAPHVQDQRDFVHVQALQQLPLTDIFGRRHGLRREQLQYQQAAQQ